jgi:flagellar protein FliJ
VKKFIFKFQSVLDHKKHIEEKIKDKLSELNNKLKSQERLLDLLRCRLLESQCNWLEDNSENSNAGTAMCYQQYFLDLQIRINQEEDARIKLQEVVAVKRGEYIEAQKERMTIEKIEEKEFREYMYDVERAEQQMSDQTAVTGFIRQQRG